MALEAVVYPNDLFNYACKDLYSLSGGDWNNNNNSYDFEVKEEEEKSSSDVTGGVYTIFEKQHHQSLINNNQLYSSSCTSSTVQNLKDFQANSSTEEAWVHNSPLQSTTVAAAAETTTTCCSSRRKRRRTKSSKNIEEVENQRMTHIFVERNRRKQMNEYLSMLRSLMPPSYVQRSDQASIVGGAINFLKELEQLHQSLEAQKRLKQQQQQQQGDSAGSISNNSTHFPNLFTFPHYNSCSTHCGNSAVLNESMAENNRSGVANIEVTKVESHANLKILSKRRPKQLLKMVVEFQKLRLSILHLSVTTVDQMVLYSFSTKVEEECQLTSVDEISMAVYQVLDRINSEEGA